MRYTLKDVTNFCYKNKRVKGFRAFEWDEVGETILWAADNGKLCFVVDGKGICGVVVFTVIKDFKRLYIHHIVAVRKGFRMLIDVAFRHFKDYSIVGMRNGKLITFNKRHLWATLAKV